MEPMSAPEGRMGFSPTPAVGPRAHFARQPLWGFLVAVGDSKERAASLVSFGAPARCRHPGSLLHLTAFSRPVVKDTQLLLRDRQYLLPRTSHWRGGMPMGSHEDGPVLQESGSCSQQCP